MITSWPLYGSRKRETVTIKGRADRGAEAGDGTATPGGIRCSLSGLAPQASATTAVGLLTVTTPVAWRTANAASRGRALTSPRCRYWMPGTLRARRMSQAAGLVTTCALSTACGRKRSASTTAAALSHAMAPLCPRIRGFLTRRISTGSSRSNSRAPGASNVKTRASMFCQCRTNPCISRWMPPGAGGKSGVSTRTRARCRTRRAAGRSRRGSADDPALPSRLHYLTLSLIPLTADPADHEPDQRGDRIVAAVEPLAKTDHEHTDQREHDDIRRPQVEPDNPAQYAHDHDHEEHSSQQPQLDEGVQEVDFRPGQVYAAPGADDVGRYRADAKRILQALL